jgi:hypothetical protein
VQSKIGHAQGLYAPAAVRHSEHFLAYIDWITVSFAGLRMRGDLDMSVTAYGSWYRGKAGAMSASLNRHR